MKVILHGSVHLEGSDAGIDGDVTIVDGREEPGCRDFNVLISTPQAAIEVELSELVRALKAFE